MPTAGEIKNKVDNAFKNMGDINANVKVNAKINSKSISGIKSKLKQALNQGDGIKLNFTANAKGLERVKSQLTEIRRLAKEPIKLNVDSGLEKFDRQLESAQRSAGDKFSQSMAKEVTKQNKELLKAQREVERLNRQMMGEKTSAIKQPDFAKEYEDSAKRYEQQLKQAKSRYAALAKESGLDQRAISKKLSDFTSDPKSTRNLAIAEKKREIAAATAEWKKYRQAINEVYSAEQKIDKGNIGRHEKAQLEANIRARRQEAALIRQNLSASRQEEARNLEIQQRRSRELIRARRQDGAFSSRAKRSGSILNTMNVWDMLQSGVGMAAGVVSALNEVDKEITKVTKVVPDSQRAVNAWKKNIYKDAASVGKTAPEFASAVEQWATAGYNLKQSVGLAKTSVMGSFVGEVPVEDMVKYMSVPMKAFQKEGLKDKDIINAMNEVANKHAIEMDDLGAAYQKASSTVGATGTSFSQLTGIITAAQEGTRAGGDMIGTAFKTIGSRLAKMGTGLTKQDKARAAFFKGLNVDLTDSNGNLKSTWEIMDQLGNKWDSLSKKDKNTAAQYAAGANHANIFSATMDNWKTARKSMMEAQGQVNLRDKDHGSAYQEFNKQKQSIQFQLAQLQNTWTQFLQNISGGREGIGQILSLLNGLGTGMSKVAENKALSSTIRWGAIVAGAMMARRAIVGVTKSMWELGREKTTDGGSLFKGHIKAAKDFKEQLEQIKDAWRDFTGKETLRDSDFGKLKERKGTTKDDQFSKSDRVKTSSRVGTIYYEETTSSRSGRKKDSQGRKKQNLPEVKKSVDDLQSTTTAMNNMSATMTRASSSASTLGKKTAGTTRAATKLGKAWTVLKSVAGLAGPAIGGVGLALDGLTIGMGVLGAMGIDPIKSISRAFNPAKANAEDFSKSLGSIHSNIGKINKSLDSNVIFNGTAKSSKSTMSSLNNMLKNASGNQLDKGSYAQFKKSFNAIAKANGLNYRASGNNVELLREQMQDLRTGVKDATIKDIVSGVNGLGKLGKQFKKINSESFKESMLGTSKNYLNKKKKLDKELSDIQGDQFTTQNQKAKAKKDYQRKLSKLNADQFRKMRGTDEYNAWADQYDSAASSIRAKFSKLSGALKAGVFTKADYGQMSNNQLRTLQTAQTVNVQQAARANKIWKEVNGVLKGNNKYAAQQGKLTREQQQWLSKNVKGLEGVSKNTSKWSDEQKQAFEKYGKSVAKNLSNQKKRLAEILEAQGYSRSTAKRQVDKLDGTGTRYAQALGNNTNAAALMNVDADYQALYGGKWYPRFLDQQRQLDSLKVGKYANSPVVQALIDPNTGLQNTGLISRGTALMTDNNKAKKWFQNNGLLDKNGTMNLNTMARAFNGVRGADNPLGLLDDIRTGRINKKSALHVAANLSNGKLNKDVKSKIRDLVKSKGTGDAVDYLKDLEKSGALHKKDAKEARDYARKYGRSRSDDRSMSPRERAARQAERDATKKNNKNASWWDKFLRATGFEKTASASVRGGSHSRQPSRADLWKDLLIPKQLRSGNFGKIFGGFKKGGLFGGIGNLGKMSMNGMEKLLFGKKINFGNMFKGAKNPFKGIQSSFKKIKLPNLFSGKGNPFSKLFGGKNNPFSKLFGGKGKKIKLQADTKGLSKSISKLDKGKGTKVKLQADTKALTKSLSGMNKGKGVKVKVQADTKSLSSSLKKGSKSKIKVKVDADTKGLKSKIKSATKGQKAKVKVTANTSGLRSKIKSATRGITAKVKVTANTSGLRSKIKSAAKGVTAKVKVIVSGEGKLQSLKSTLAAVHGKTVKVKASVSGTGRVNALRSAINGVHSKSVTVKASVSGLGEVQALSAAIAAVHSKSVTISATKVEKGKSITSDSVAIGGPTNPLQSMSIVAGAPALAGALMGGAASMGVDANSAMNGQKVTDYSDSTQDVNEDYWRYMDKQLYTGLPLDEQVNKLESAVTQADEDMDKLISLSRQRIDLDNRQIAYQRSMQGAYQQQITDTINELHKYGFQNNGNTITNLAHAKDIHGDNASKVDELLGKYQSAYQNFSEATNKIQELQTDIWQQNKNQQDYNNTKDQKMVEQFQRDLEIVNTAIDNQKNILERQADSLTDGDYRMRLKNSSDQIDAKQNAVQQLLAQFNRLSVANFVGTKEADNAKNLLESLQSIRDSIAENLDSIDELKKTMRDTQLNSIIEGLQKYTDNLNDSIDRLKNNVSNLQDGLLSGTTYSDLISSNFDVVNLNQQDAYTKSVNDRIALEQDLDRALDQFARKNVDRTAQVANQELQVEAQKYNQMLAMATEYSRGFKANPTEIQSEYKVSVETDRLEVGDITHNESYLNASLEYQKEMNALKDDYNEKMAKATTAEEKETLNQAMVYEQLAMQVKVYREMIYADKQAIKDLKEQAKNPDMNSEQLKTITDQIKEYEKNVMDAQNNIKDAIKGRFDYEKQLMDKQMDDYKRLSDTISNLVTIADALHLDGATQAAIINQQYAATYREYDNYLNVLERLRTELSQYEKGSFEYNQLSSMINDYQSSLNSTVNSLLDITKNSFDQTLNSIQDSFEKSVNDGMTANQAKFDQDVWYNPMQKELKLEEMRLKITELEDKTVEKRIAALDAQERMSRAEADYVDKQLDLALAQQKLNNTINKKDVRYLEKDENGKFNWTYIADQDQVDAARQEVNQARQALEDAKVSNRNDYIEKVEEVISGAKDGSLNQEEVKKRLEQLNNSYKFILKDIPTFDISKVEDILQAYDEYEKKNADIIKEYQRSADVAKTDGYQEIVKGFGEQFKALSKDLGEIFGKQLKEALNLPDGIRNAYGTGKDNSLTINGDLNLELPNVHNGNDFAEALKNLPQLAKQYVSRK